MKLKENLQLAFSLFVFAGSFFTKLELCPQVSVYLENFHFLIIFSKYFSYFWWNTVRSASSFWIEIIYSIFYIGNLPSLTQNLKCPTKYIWISKKIKGSQTRQKNLMSVATLLLFSKTLGCCIRFQINIWRPPQ